MELRDWFLFATTLLMGLLAGMYLYFTTFVPEYVNNQDIQELVEERRASLLIIGETYGGCAMARSCETFSVEGNRQYRYQPGVVMDRAAQIETGDVTRALYSYVEDAVAASDLAFLSSPEQRTCASWSDGLDVRYRVTYDSVEYLLDSCTTKFSRSSELGAALEELFIYMAAPERYELPVAASSGIGGFIEKRIEDSFSE